MVTVTQTGSSSPRARSIRLAAEPWTYKRPSTRAWMVGIT